MKVTGFPGDPQVGGALDTVSRGAAAGQRQASPWRWGQLPFPPQSSPSIWASRTAQMEAYTLDLQMLKIISLASRLLNRTYSIL